MPAEAISDRTGVLGVLGAENLRIQVGGLQPRPGRVQRFARLVGVVAELGGGGGVTDGQRGEELSAAGPGPWGRGVQPDMATTASSSKPEVAEANVVLVTIVADVKNCDGDTGRDTPRPNRYAETRSRMEHHRENRGQKSQPRYARDRSIEQGADRKHQQT